MIDFSFAAAENKAFIEALYQDYKKDPQSVDMNWRAFFAGFELSGIISTRPDSVVMVSNNEDQIKEAYRRYGHLRAKLDPLNLCERPNVDLPKNEQLEKTYCGFIGAEFFDIKKEAKEWLQNEMELCQNAPALDEATKKRIIYKLAEAETFEKFLHSRYLGQKRFSVEGLDSLLPLLDTLLEESKKQGVKEACLGMAHRGRLNVLAHIMGKPYEEIFAEFEGNHYHPGEIDGDVKYHMGFSSEQNGINLYLAYNPSHLEAVNPIITGYARARQEVSSMKEVLPLLLHGDAAFMGQGVVYETINMSRLEGYKVGGTIHIITNNQVGFTANPKEVRSTTYCSDVVKFISAPVLHVNADEPEAVAWVAMLAARYRAKFLDDIVIDLVGYRRHGHNETDEPMFTQPLMYEVIKNHPSVLSRYPEATLLQEKIKKKMDSAQKSTFKKIETVKKESAPVTAKLKALTPLKLPSANFNMHPKLKKLWEARTEMMRTNIDWGLAELLAFSSLIDEGYNVRLTGQDAKRGTFSSRQVCLFDTKTGEEFNVLGPKFTVLNSPLSEYAPMGFELGYTFANEKALVLWEAQFGDFVNGAQIIIDQFLAASKSKWGLSSNLVLLLPHGYEGMGPEHSSARLERFLQLCTDDNLRVVNLTQASQIFHALRRQVLSERMPLIVMTPKSLLRHSEVASPVKDLIDGKFEEILDRNNSNKNSTKLILCSGKIYFELKAHPKSSEIPIITLEQLNPFPEKALKQSITKSYKKLETITWVQEEPKNMGAFRFVEAHLKELFPKIKLEYLGRKTAGSTAEGKQKAHQEEQTRIIENAFK